MFWWDGAKEDNFVSLERKKNRLILKVRKKKRTKTLMSPNFLKNTLWGDILFPFSWHMVRVPNKKNVFFWTKVLSSLKLSTKCVVLCCFNFSSQWLDSLKVTITFQNCLPKLNNILSWFSSPSKMFFFSLLLIRLWIFIFSLNFF